MKQIILLAFTTLLALCTYAQSFNFNQTKENKHIVYLETGVEYGLVAKLGYARKVEIASGKIVWATDLTLPYLKLDLHDYKFKTGVHLPIYSINNWVTSATINLIARGMQTNYNTSFNLGYELGVKTGIYNTRWFLASEFGFDHALLSHIRNSEFYRTHYYYDAKNAWYKNSGGNIYYGFVYGFTIKKSDFSIRIDKVLDRNFTSPSDFSANVILGFQRRF